MHVPVAMRRVLVPRLDDGRHGRETELEHDERPRRPGRATPQAGHPACERR